MSKLKQVFLLANFLFAGSLLADAPGSCERHSRKTVEDVLTLSDQDDMHATIDEDVLNVYEATKGERC